MKLHRCRSASTTPGRQTALKIMSKLLPNKSEVFPSSLDLHRRLSWIAFTKKNRSQSVKPSKIPETEEEANHLTRSTASLSTDVESDDRLSLTNWPPSSCYPEQVEDKILMRAILCRYRPNLNFCLFPLPKRLSSSLSCFVLSSKSSTSNSVEFSFVIRVANSDGTAEDIVLMKSTCAQNRMNKLQSRRRFKILLGGIVNTNIGQVSCKKGSCKIKARSFKKGFDNEHDFKGEVVIENVCHSDAPLYEICSMKNQFVQIDGVSQVQHWDAVQSVSGYYGKECSWPYVVSRDQKELVHNNLFNGQSRRSEIIGKVESSSNFKIYSSGRKVSLVNGKRILYSLKPNGANPSEYEISFQSPMSPIQAFGLFIGMKYKDH